MSETWADDEGALDFIKELKRRRSAQLEMLVGAAKHSNDPVIRMNVAAISQLEQVIEMMEDERGKPDHDE